MNKPFLEIDPENFSLSNFDSIPLKDYQVPFSKETNKKFPFCCSFHSSLLEKTTRWFEVFPNCCEKHKIIGKQQWFAKSNYINVPMKIVKQVSYTEHTISKVIENEDWFENITDYIEYNVLSFGHPAIGLDLYLGALKVYLEKSESNMTTTQRQKILNYINTYYKPTDTPNSNLNELYDIYQKWLKEFPFELIGYFGNLKQHFEKQLPILNGKPEINIYTGMAKAKMHTKSSLIDALLSLTKELLNRVNVREMVEQGIISDLNKHRFELESESLRIATSQITKDFSKGEQKYIKALKKWLQLHKEYFKNITPLLKALPPQQIETETPTFTNNFDNIKPTEIYKHFKAGLVEKGYLTEKELNEYLKAAFELQTKPEILFKLKHTPTKQKIYTVFYTYYKDIAQKKHERQKDYAALLGDFFEGYKTEIIQTNWARDYKTKR